MCFGCLKAVLNFQHEMQKSRLEMQGCIFAAHFHVCRDEEADSEQVMLQEEEVLALHIPA